MNGKNGLCMYVGMYICTYPLRNVCIYRYRYLHVCYVQ